MSENKKSMSDKKKNKKSLINSTYGCILSEIYMWYMYHTSAIFILFYKQFRCSQYCFIKKLVNDCFDNISWFKDKVYLFKEIDENTYTSLYYAVIHVNKRF